MPLGITSCIYLNTGSYGSPSWQELDLVADLQVAAGRNEGDSSVRRGRIETTEITNLKLELSGKVRKDMSDTAFLALRAAFLNGSTLDVLVLDGPRTVNNSEGFRFDAKVFKFDEDQGLQAVAFKDFTIKPCMSANLPKSVIVTGGAPDYSAIGP